MRYCLYCKRINTDHPLFCQFCGRSFEVRICRSCRHINPLEALTCGRCGGRDLSEPAGSPMLWLVFLKWIFWILVILLLVGLVKNFEAVAAFFIILGFFYLAYLCLPQPLQGLVKRMLKAAKDLMFNKQGRE